MFDDKMFHEIVRDEKLKENNIITFQPLMGEFQLMQYRISKNFIIPFYVTPFISLENPFKLEVELNIKNELPENITSRCLKLRFNIPDKTSSVSYEIAKEEKGMTFEHDKIKKIGLWTIKNFKGS